MKDVQIKTRMSDSSGLERETGFEPATSGLGSRRSAN
jgi:hypothetical protein